MIEFLGSSCFLEHHCLLFAFEASSASNTKLCSNGKCSCQCSCLVSLRLSILIPVLALSLAELPRAVSPPEFCAHRTLQILYTYHVSPLVLCITHRCPIKFSLIKFKFKDKFLRMSRSLYKSFNPGSS